LTDFTVIGEAFIHNAFAGSYEFAGIVIFLLFAFMLWKARAPMAVNLLMGLGLCYTLWMFGADVFGSIFMLGLLAMGVFVGMAILNWAKP